MTHPSRWFWHSFRWGWSKGGGILASALDSVNLVAWAMQNPCTMRGWATIIVIQLVHLTLIFRFGQHKRQLDWHQNVTNRLISLIAGSLLAFQLAIEGNRP